MCQEVEHMIEMDKTRLPFIKEGKLSASSTVDSVNAEPDGDSSLDDLGNFKLWLKFSEWDQECFSMLFECVADDHW